MLLLECRSIAVDDLGNRTAHCNRIIEGYLGCGEGRTAQQRCRERGSRATDADKFAHAQTLPDCFSMGTEGSTASPVATRRPSATSNTCAARASQRRLTVVPSGGAKAPLLRTTIGRSPTVHVTSASAPRYSTAVTRA